MVRISTIVVLLTLLPSFLQAQTISLPEKVEGEVSDFIKITAKTDGEIVKWYTPDKGLSVFPGDLLKDPKTTVIIGKKEGRYRLIAWTAKDNVPSDPAETLVIIGDGVDPNPPAPDPDPPKPPDDLTGLSKTVYDLAKKVDNKEETKKIKENYETVNSTIAAGAYGSLDGNLTKEKRDSIIGTVFNMNRPISEANNDWRSFFSDLGKEFQKLDESGKIKTVGDLKGLFEEIVKGLGGLL